MASKWEGGAGSMSGLRTLTHLRHFSAWMLAGIQRLLVRLVKAKVRKARCATCVEGSQQISQTRINMLILLYLIHFIETRVKFFFNQH